MRPAEAGRPPDLECGRGWRDSLTLVRSAFAFYSQTPSQKRKGVQYCTQCNGLPDTALIHIHLGQISNDLSAQKRTLCRTSYVTPATLGARATFSSEGGLGRILRHAYVRSFVLFPSRSYSPPSSIRPPSPRHHASDTRLPPTPTSEVRRTRATLDDVIIACAVADDPRRLGMTLVK